MRMTIKNAVNTPSSVMVKIQNFASTCSPGVYSRFKTAVNTAMNSTGFSPLRMDFTGTLDRAMEAHSTRNMMP